MGKVCVCGASALHVSYEASTLEVGGHKFKQGDWLSIDGTSGTVYAGEVKTAPSEVIQGLIEGDATARQGRTYQNFVQLMKWCAQATKMQVRTNADSPEQTCNAVAFGAVGIGLTRTEHMFFEGDRIDAMREMILSDTLEAREIALAKLLPYQRADFLGIFKALAGLPATIRFLDPVSYTHLDVYKRQTMDTLLVLIISDHVATGNAGGIGARAYIGKCSGRRIVESRVYLGRDVVEKAMSMVIDIIIISDDIVATDAHGEGTFLVDACTHDRVGFSECGISVCRNVIEKTVDGIIAFTIYILLIHIRSDNVAI